jgi:serine/threonine-protein kinase
MKDKGQADTEPAAAFADESQAESWLRDAVRAPRAARLPGPGDVIGGKYRIEQLLGRGGMGAVFRARHIVSEKPVAIKWMLRPATDEQARRRFEREARAAGRIDHPNVVGPYDIGQEDDCSYLVMELLRGESLRSRLARGPLPAVEAVETLIPAMRGVAAAHQAGVVHRDLKPDNIFLCQAPDGELREAKVLDFGVSSITSSEAVDTTLTQEGTLLGSLAYMSPEQLSNPHDVDARADVYAFGVILYEALTGALPFRGPSHSALAVAIVTAQPERPSQICGELTLELERVVLRAFARERTDRYEDMQSLIEALLPLRAPQPQRSGEPLGTSSLPATSLPPAAVAHPDGLDDGSDGPGTARRKSARRGSRVAWAAACVFAVVALWAASSRFRGTDQARSAQPGATAAQLVPTTPSGTPPRDSLAPSPPPSAVQTLTRVQLQPTAVQPQVVQRAVQATSASAKAKAAPRSSAATAATGNRSNQPEKSARARWRVAAQRSGGSGARNVPEPSEDVLFSGRK